MFRAVKILDSFEKAPPRASMCAQFSRRGWSCGRISSVLNVPLRISVLLAECDIADSSSDTTITLRMSGHCNLGRLVVHVCEADSALGRLLWLRVRVICRDVKPAVLKVGVIWRDAKLWPVSKVESSVFPWLDIDLSTFIRYAKELAPDGRYIYVESIHAEQYRRRRYIGGREWEFVVVTVTAVSGALRWL